VDYDSTPIPDLYVQARRLPAEAMGVWRRVVQDMLPPAPSICRVLDLGCGTARFTEMLNDIYAAPVVGVDPSLRMLAKRAPSTNRAVQFIAAHAEDLPLGAGSMDLVFLSMVYHHLQPGRAVAEIARVLTRTGHAVVRNPTRETVAEFEYMRFFPEALAFDLGRMPSRASLAEAFTAHGLEAMSHRVVSHPFAASYIDYFRKISARAISSLQAIPDDAFERGLAAFERHCRGAPDRPIFEPVEVFLFGSGALRRAGSVSSEGLQPAL
jgi:ubiquinone/menaquinone biosynthesis C-methylase UbiE